jgi:hypothetical protein
LFVAGVLTIVRRCLATGVDDDSSATLNLTLLLLVVATSSVETFSFSVFDSFKLSK